MFVCAIEIRNAWVIEYSCNSPTDDNAVDRVKKILKEYGGSKGEHIWIWFDNCDTSELEPKILQLKRDLAPNKINGNLYNLSLEDLSRKLSDFVKTSMSCGLTRIYPWGRLIDKKVLGRCIPHIRSNKESIDNKIYKCHLENIEKARYVYSSAAVLYNIDLIINRIYNSQKNKFKSSIFDQEGGRIQNLYYSSDEWYEMPRTRDHLMVATGAFGYNDYNGIRFLAFERLRSNFSAIEGRGGWRAIDYLMPDLISRKLDLLHLYSWGRHKGFVTSHDMLKALPIENLIPGGLHIFSDCIDEDVEFELSNFYPDVEYTTIEWTG